MNQYIITGCPVLSCAYKENESPNPGGNDDSRDCCEIISWPCCQTIAGTPGQFALSCGGFVAVLPALPRCHIQDNH